MLKQVGINPRIESSPGRRSSGGGGQFGQLAGAALGAGAIMATGGMAAPAVAGAAPAVAAAAPGAGAILGGAATGSSLGGLLGNAIDPAKAGQAAISRRIESNQPQLLQSENSQKLKQSLMALHEAPPEISQQYGPQLLEAYLKSVNDDVSKGVA